MHPGRTCFEARGPSGLLFGVLARRLILRIAVGIVFRRRATTRLLSAVDVVVGLVLLLLVLAVRLRARFCFRQQPRQLVPAVESLTARMEANEGDRVGNQEGGKGGKKSRECER